MKIEYKSFIVSQASNNHVAIFKDNEMVFHAPCKKKFNEEELKKVVDFYLWLLEIETED